jgi:hypothetical protein
MALPTISVLDGAGVPQTVNRLASGRQSAADSAAVAFSIEDLAALNTVPILGRTTREFNLANGQRTAIAAATTTPALALPTLGASRELRLRATSACFINFGVGTGVAATIGATSYSIDANLPDVIVVPTTATHYSIIRETADGFLNLTPVA